MHGELYSKGVGTIRKSMPYQLLWNQRTPRPYSSSYKALAAGILVVARFLEGPQRLWNMSF